MFRHTHPVQELRLKFSHYHQKEMRRTHIIAVVVLLSVGAAALILSIPAMIADAFETSIPGLTPLNQSISGGNLWPNLLLIVGGAVCAGLGIWLFMTKKNSVKFAQEAEKKMNACDVKKPTHRKCVQEMVAACKRTPSKKCCQEDLETKNYADGTLRKKCASINFPQLYSGPKDSEGNVKQYVVTK